MDLTFWQDRAVLVTGSTGLVGGVLVRRLLGAQADVVCLVRDWIPRSELVRSHLLDRVRVVRGDVANQSTLERTLAEYEVVTVFHLAAQTIVGVANRNPVSTFETNIAGTWRLLEACRRSPTVSQVVVASSDKAYGEHAALPYHEDTPLQGRHPYDVSKSCADLISQSYAATFGLPVVISRCGNFYGGGDLNWNRLIPGTIRSIIRGQRPVVRSDGSLVRDYLYVDDGADAYVLLAEQLAAKPHLAGTAFNFSSEQPRSVLEVVETILSLMGSPARPDIRSEAHHEIGRQFLDASRARTELGWRPGFTFEGGLEPTIAAYKAYFEAAG